MAGTRVHEVHIEASPEAVYDYVSDVARHPEWAHNRVDINHLAGTTGEVGTTYAYVTHFLGDARGTITVIEAERPSRFTYDCSEASGVFRWTFEIAPEGSGTRLRHVFQPVKLALVSKLLMPLLLPLFGKKMIGGGLANIKARLEAGSATPV